MPPPATASFRLCTIFGTVLYVDEATGELRHGAIEGSPANAVFAEASAAPRAARSGRLWHEAPAAPSPIASSAAGSWSAALARPPAGSAAAPDFACTPVERDWLGLRADGLYLCAEIDGRVTHSRRECGPWERFRLVEATLAGDRLAARARPDTMPPFPGVDVARYHLGCGPNLIPGWLNIDRAAGIAEARVFADFNGVSGAYFANWDLGLGIPGRDNSLEAIYHCHFLEHLALADGINLLRQARQRLKPGGMMRAVVPDLELWIDNYRRDNAAFFAEYRRLALGDNAVLYRTKGAVFMGMLHNHGHKCGYDFETLEWVLRATGFTNIRRTAFREGSFAGLPAIEPNSPLRAMESLCVECEKPPAIRPTE